MGPYNIKKHQRPLSPPQNKRERSKSKNKIHKLLPKRNKQDMIYKPQINNIVNP